MINEKSQKYKFKIVDLDSLNISEFNSYSNKSVFTTVPWIKFVANDSKAEPLIVKIYVEDRTIGYFSALMVKKLGIKILGSPFPGWSTCYMGIDTEQITDKRQIIDQLVKYLFKNTGCHFIQINDRDVSVVEAEEYGFPACPAGTLELKIDMDDAALFKQMKVDCRNFIRQFERRGAKLEIAEPNREFAKQYYTQLEDVFAKQGLVPTYSLEKVNYLMDIIGKTDNLLCLRVISPEGECIATSIFLGYGSKFFFWGGASYRAGQHYRPNEYMIWTAIKYWRERGCKIFDMVGIRDYKRKFGSHEEYYASMEFARNIFLPIAKHCAQWAYYKLTAVKGFLLRKH